MKINRVAVIGSGPAGLLAAHAAARRGATVDVFSDTDRPSFVHGATYLHKPIPDLALPEPAHIRYRYIGSAEHYADKIYGPGFDPKLTSWGRYGSLETGWSMPSVYADLFSMYHDRIVVHMVRPDDVYHLTQSYPLVVNTAPLIKLVHERDRQHFRSEQVICGPIPDDHEVEPFTIIYNGAVDSTWYRESNLWGITSREYQLRNRVLGEARAEDYPGPGFVITKPVSVDNGLEALPGVLKVGRYGSWTKSALADDAFTKVTAEMERADAAL